VARVDSESAVLHRLRISDVVFQRWRSARLVERLRRSFGGQPFDQRV